MTGRDTKAHLTGFAVGLVGIAIVVMTQLTDRDHMVKVRVS